MRTYHIEAKRMAKLWTRKYEHKTGADAAAVWTRLSDVSTWKDWNAGVAAVSLEGPFADGTWFAMEIPEGPTLRTQLVEVRAPHFFVDRTLVDGTTVEVCHRVAPLPSGGSVVSFEVRAEGLLAAECGEGASADFPHVLASLASLVEKETR
jgi:hypothetical protein